MVMWLHAPTPYTLAAAADMYSKTKSKTTQVHKVHALGAFRENKNAKLAVQTAIREIYVPRKLELIYCNDMWDRDVDGKVGVLQCTTVAMVTPVADLWYVSCGLDPYWCLPYLLYLIACDVIVALFYTHSQHTSITL